jgi:hypothetical protein
MEWYTALGPEKQVALQGLIVMGLFALVKAIAFWAKRPLSNTAVAKVGKLLVVAVATAATTLVTNGVTPQFWLQWVMAMGLAIGSWEILAKGYGLTVPETTTEEPT